MIFTFRFATTNAHSSAFLFSQPHFPSVTRKQPPFPFLVKSWDNLGSGRRSGQTSLQISTISSKMWIEHYCVPPSVRHRGNCGKQKQAAFAIVELGGLQRRQRHRRRESGQCAWTVRSASRPRGCVTVALAWPGRQERLSGGSGSWAEG